MADVETALSNRGVNIPIRDTITLNSTFKTQEQTGSKWCAAILSVDAYELVTLSTKYGDLLFSANLTDYLGSRRSARNVNLRIEQTDLNRSDDFGFSTMGSRFLLRDMKSKVVPSSFRA